MFSHLHICSIVNFPEERCIFFSIAFSGFSSSSLLTRWTIGILQDCDTYIRGLESRVEARESEVLELRRDNQELENRCTHAAVREDTLSQTVRTQKQLIESLREEISRSVNEVWSWEDTG